MKIFTFLLFSFFSFYCSISSQAMHNEIEEISSPSHKNIVHGWAAREAKQPLEPYTYDMNALGAQEVEIAVDYCGLCHSDLSVINNDWGMSQYPFIPGHEVVGRIVDIGEHVQSLKIGQVVGVGWNASSCMYCSECMVGNNNLCEKAVPTIIGHQGGFAEKIRSHWAWAIPLPEKLDISTAGPLLCGGATVFAPLYKFVKPTDHVGVIGIGGLGHMALQFARAWGCEVTAFSSNLSKTEEIKKFGAHNVISSLDSTDILKTANSLDFLLITVNTPLDWESFLKTLKPNGRMHVVGAVLKPMKIPALNLIFGHKNVSGSPIASPAVTSEMLNFAARHRITPQVESFPMSQVNVALKHLAEGNARYRVVLKSDFDSLM